MEGSYTYTSSEGYDEFLGKRGVPWIVRKMILAAPVELQVSLFAIFFHVKIASKIFFIIVCWKGVTRGSVDSGL